MNERKNINEDMPDDLKLTINELHSKNFRHREHSLEFLKVKSTVNNQCNWNKNDLEEFNDIEKFKLLFYFYQ